jgi:hypothetical protein
MLFITLQILKLHMVLFKLEMIQTDKKLFYTVITKKTLNMIIVMTHSNDRGFISGRCVISRNETLNAHHSPFNYVNSYSHPFNYFNP